VTGHEGLPAGWAARTLDEFTQERGRSIDPRNSRDTIFELYSVPSFDAGAPELISGGEVGSSKQVVASGSVLLCKINPRINRSWSVKPRGEHHQIASTEWIVFPPCDAFEPDYLRYFMQQQTLRNFLAANVSGVGGSLMRVKPSTLKGYPFPLAPRPEQQRIVEKIESLFAEISKGEEALREVQKLLSHYRQSILKFAVSGELTADWRAANGPPRETGQDLLARICKQRRESWHGRGKFKEPPELEVEGLPELPESWAWATLPMLGEFGRGKSKHRPRNDPKLYEGGTFPFLQTGRVRNSSGRISDYDKLYNARGLAQSKLWPAGTICITIAANIAESGILEIDACFPDSVVGLVPHQDIDGAYVELFVRTAKADLDRYAPATAQKNINIETLNNVAVPLPPSDEQKEIGDRVTSLIGASMVVERSLVDEMRRGAALRQSILKDAFSGKLVPQDPSDEPAGVLLDRDRAARTATSKHRVAMA
jgi:type I restriction enzyme S subunit